MQRLLVLLTRCCFLCAHSGLPSQPHSREGRFAEKQGFNITLRSYLLKLWDADWNLAWSKLTASHCLNAQTNNGVYLLSTMQICSAGDSRGLKYRVFCSKLKLFSRLQMREAVCCNCWDIIVLLIKAWKIFLFCLVSKLSEKHKQK